MISHNSAPAHSAKRIIEYLSNEYIELASCPSKNKTHQSFPEIKLGGIRFTNPDDDAAAVELTSSRRFLRMLRLKLLDWLD